MSKKLIAPARFSFFLSFLLLLSCDKTNSSIDLSAEEQSWLQQHRGSIIVATEENFPPFSMIDHNGFFRGISADYLSEIEEVLGVSFVTAPPFHLAKNLEFIKNKEVDMITSLSKTEERSAFLLFSKPYCKIPVVIITSDTLQNILEPRHMKGLRIGVGLDYGVHEYLLKNYPQLLLFPQYDDLICLQKLAIGELDAVITDLSSASYFIRENNMLHLKVSGSIDYTYELCMATSMDQHLLASSIDKAIAKISSEKKDEILEKWGALKIPLSKYEQIATIITPIFLLLIVLLLVGLYSKRKKRTSFNIKHIEW